MEEYKKKCPKPIYRSAVEPNKANPTARIKPNFRPAVEPDIPKPVMKLMSLDKTEGEGFRDVYDSGKRVINKLI